MEKVMQYTLYKDDVQARRVVDAAQQALASTSHEEMPYVKRHVSIAPTTLAGTIGTWSLYNVMLHQRAVELVEEPCRRHGITIQTLGEYPLFRGTKLVHGRASDVVIVPAEEDPLFKIGKFPVPLQVDQRLQAIEKAGVPIDMLYIYIAHEVPRGSVSEEGPLPLQAVLPPAPAQTVRLSRQLGTVAHAATSTLLGGLVRAATLGIGSVGLLGLGTGNAATRLLDPLIFGAIADERGIATWFVLAQWAW